MGHFNTTSSPSAVLIVVCVKSWDRHKANWAMRMVKNINIGKTVKRTSKINYCLIKPSKLLVQIN
ncbi:hypothetical protein BpHYR1_032300 [Brachionus plicatilis]|uniref:Uncharacterized protein n=1 Tax=Brachionus plicatilis TaxID=10195 RepID=A0A3M7Q520_BRAPC|nr:hypothetical protein BpHYR1_032300 [Brachionus plicatilis]